LSELKKGARPVADRISLRLRRNDLNVFTTIDEPGRRPVVHVAGRHPVALCPSCARPSGTTNGCGWRDVIDVVRTVVITLSVCVRRFLCEEEDCPQRSFDERFEGIGRGGASSRALGFFADLARGRATRAVARDLGVPEHYLRMAVGAKRRAAHERRRGRLGPHLAIDECSVRKNFVYATVFSDPGRGVVIDLAPGRDAAAVLFFAGLYSHAERAAVRVVTIDCHAPYRAVARVVFPNALIVADAFHLHRRVLAALTEVRRDAWNRWRHRSRRLGKPFKDARFALARSREALVADDSRTGERQRLALYDATNLDVPLSIAYELKEAFRTAMAIGKTGDVETFTAALELFDALCMGSGIDAFVTLAKTLRGWRTEIVNYAASVGASNGFAESLNHLIKNQKRQAHGYRTWAGFRGQILWAYGEAVDPDTGEVKPLRAVPRGLGANWIQPSFA
jgi:transposase